MEIYERIKILRKEHLNLTQTEFGKHIGVSRDVVKNMELNLVDVKEHFIKLICTEFNVNENWLRYGQDNMFDELSEDEEMMALIGELSADGNVNKRRALRAAAMIIKDDACWSAIEEILDKCSLLKKKE